MSNINPQKDTIAVTTITCPNNNNINNSTTTTTLPNSTTAAALLPAPTKARSPQEIARLVQQRVQERDEWLVDGEPQEKSSHMKEMGKFMGDVLPKYIQLKHPSQDWLDKHFPVQAMDWKRLQNPPPNSIQMTWLGHASVLIQVQGCTILTDPVFSQRCAPTQFSGPKRIRPTPCSIAELCQHLLVDVVLISHNHYDHLDYATVRDIHKYSPATSFVVPLGLRAWMHKNISKPVIVHELDWHEYIDYSYSPATGVCSDNSSSSSSSSSNLQGGQQRDCIRIVSVPMRHWSSRVGADRDKTLWCGYSIVTQPFDDTEIVNDNSKQQQQQQQQQRKILFPGDTAWFDGLDELIGQTYGPFDVAAIPIGAYEPREFMKRNHINVHEAVRMKDAVQARHAVPIHWGTFPLTVEPFLEPRELLQELMGDRDDANSFTPWLIGETKQFSEDPR